MIQAILIEEGLDYMQEFIIDIEQQMISILDNMQMEELHKVLIESFQGVSIVYQSSEVQLNHNRYMRRLEMRAVDKVNINKIDITSFIKSNKYDLIKINYIKLFFYVYMTYL